MGRAGPVRRRPVRSPAPARGATGGQREGAAPLRMAERRLDARVTDHVADRVTTRVTDRVTTRVTDSATDRVTGRVTDRVTDRVSARVTDRVVATARSTSASSVGFA